MGCKHCDWQTDNPDGVYYYRIGNEELGWGNIGIIGCRRHVKLAIDKLNKDEHEE